MLLDANENALGPALVLQNDRLFNDTSSASTNISKKLDIDSVNLNRYADPYTPLSFTVPTLTLY